MNKKHETLFQTIHKHATRVFIALLSFLLSVPTVLATDFSSSNFILRDPVMSIEGGQTTSSSFQLLSSTGQTDNGLSSSASFDSRAGFLYFTVGTTPVVSASAGNSQVVLSWTASVGTHGNVTAYEVGTATVSGGPYTFENVGNVLSFTKTGLTNNTTYFFRVRALAGTLPVALSAEVSATPTAPPPSNNGGGGGGGGGAPPSAPATTVIFQGRAYPSSVVTILLDATVLTTTIAGKDARFQVSVSNLSAGMRLFSIYTEDPNFIRSSALTFPVSITSGVTTTIGGIFLAPSIGVDKEEVKQGDNIAIFGQTSPDANVNIMINSAQQIVKQQTADKDGVYLLNFDTSPLEIATHSAKAKAATAGEISSFGNPVSFRVGTANIPVKKSGCPQKADLNNDCKVNIVDFSIAAFWYKKNISPSFSIIEGLELNNDGKIDLIDFSILAFYWTG
jgi:hypothetical protein